MSINVFDLHLLATLHLANFRQVGKQFDINWYRGDVEQKAVVHLEGRDSNMLQVQKQARLELCYQ